MVPNRDVHAQILKSVNKKAEEYDKEVLSGLFVRVYIKGDQESSEIMLPLISEQIAALK